MPETWTDVGLMRAWLPCCDCAMLRNPWGTAEVRGDDLVLKHTAAWITIFHRDAPATEALSHLHVRREVFRFAQVVQTPERTPRLDFWPDSDTGDRAPLSLRFLRFWERGRGASILAHQVRFSAWVTEHGRVFTLVPGEVSGARPSPRTGR